MYSAHKIPNPEQKITSVYIQDLQAIIEYLCKIINTLVVDDQVSFQSFEKVKQSVGSVKYHQKLIIKQKPISKIITQTIQTITGHSQHRTPIDTTIQMSYFPPVKSHKNQIDQYNNLATIVQKESSQSLLHNYLMKQNADKKTKYSKSKYYNQKTINQSTNNNSLGTSRQFQVIRQETRRSLDNPTISQQNKKPLYKQLQQFKGVQQMMPAVKNYLDRRNKNNFKSKNLNYTIHKFI